MNRWFHIALVNLLMAAIIGVLLRAMFLVEIPFIRFRPWLHGHSHTALLGWLFIGTLVVLLHDGGRGLLTRPLVRSLAGLQVTVICMLVSFPAQGYGMVSIAASTAHMLLSFVVLTMLWRSSSNWPAKGSRLLVRAAIVFYLVSTLGVWAIPPIILTGHQGMEIYYWAVQFFLHFQFNGWLWFAAMAMGVRWAERQGIDLRMDRITFALWVVSAIFTYALAIAWSEPHPLVFATVSMAVLLQVWAAVRTMAILRRVQRIAHDQLPFTVRLLIGLALLSMALKVLVQAGVAVPVVAVMGFTIRHFVMGFIHLNTLAIMTSLLLAYALVEGWCDLSRPASRWGILLLTAGIILSEFLLFTQGTFFWAGWGLIPGHYLHMVVAAALMPLGIALLIWSGRKAFGDRSSSR
ncbi:MAG: hypothetical protein JNM31_15080 [Flavobacteriales bacterium]|nr:hypothetical protein [Flavobacteriales bacterium]